MVSVKELKNQFFELGVDVNDEILAFCCVLCEQYGMDEPEMVESWIAYSFSKLEGGPPTIEHLKAFERSKLTDKLRTRSMPLPIFNAVEKSSPSRNSIPITFSPNNLINNQDKRLNFSPAGFSPDIYSPSVKYSSRKNSGQTVATYGKPLFNWESKNLSLKVQEYRETNSKEWKYFYGTLRNASLVLEDSSMETALAIVSRFNLPDPSPITNQTEQTVFIGRVFQVEKNKSVSVYDLCSNNDGSTENVKELDLSHMSEFVFFPGQVIAFKGTTAGNRVIVSELYSEARHPLPPPPSLKSHVEILVAAGPMTLSDTLSYEPFHDLVNYVLKNKPNLLILIGPILDSNHVKITEEGIAESFSDYYTRLLKQMEDSFEKLDIQICVISSSKDAMNIPVYPTPIPTLGRFKKIKFYPDPCILDIDGLIIGVTSTDSVFHLGKNDFSVIPSNRLGVLAGQLIDQRSFYPLHPHETENVFDLNLWKKYCSLPVTPHILIAPSDLHCFLKEYSDCIILNPGRLSKGTVGGTFSYFEILPNEEDDWKTTTHMAARILRI